jgi:hypothetical protein
MTDSFNSAVSRLAKGQQRNITRAQLLELGLSRNAIANRLKNLLLHPTPFPGVYAVGTPLVTPHEFAYAAILAVSLHAILSHSSAMALWGFWKYWERPFEVTITEGDRRPKGIKVHRSRTLTRRDIRRQYGIPATSPARTLFDIAQRLTDKQLTRAVNTGLHDKVVRRGDLATLIERFPTHPSSGRLSFFVATTDGLTDSALEDEFREFCATWGIPQPATYTRLNGFRADAYWPDEQLIAELDGWDFHNTRVDFESDRARDAANLAAGIPTIRITRLRMRNEPAKLAAEILQILQHRRRTLTGRAS